MFSLWQNLEKSSSKKVGVCFASHPHKFKISIKVQGYPVYFASMTKCFWICKKYDMHNKKL